METMRFRETKKSSYKGQVFGIILFLSIGAGITYYAISSEKKPTLIGSTQSDIVAKTNLDETDALANVDSESSKYNVTDKTITDKTNVNIKADITLPVISINDKELTAINDEIYNKFNDTYATFKKTMEKAENKFTYTVTYKVYDNVIAGNNVVSITLYERMIDDSAKTNSTEKIYAYNVDLKDGTLLEQKDVVIDILGSTYKDSIKTALQSYVVSKGMIKESQYTYSYTGLETFYIKDSKFHLIFNPDGLVNSKYGILDITI